MDSTFDRLDGFDLDQDFSQTRKVKSKDNKNKDLKADLGKQKF